MDSMNDEHESEWTEIWVDDECTKKQANLRRSTKQNKIDWWRNRKGSEKENGKDQNPHTLK